MRWLARLAAIPRDYARIGWWGLVSPRLSEAAPLVVQQAAVLSERGVLLTVRSDLRGWELPGGRAEAGEGDAEAVCREVREETGLRVAVERHVGDYRRSGFRPHLARVHLCRVLGGDLSPSAETPRVRWFPTDALPDTLFPWYRGPLSDALAERRAPVERCERQGLGWVMEAVAIDLRMRLGGDASD